MALIYLLKKSTAECSATFPSPAALIYWYGLPVQSPAANMPAMLVEQSRFTAICPSTICSPCTSEEGETAPLK